MMTKEGSTKIVNYVTPGAGIHVLGRGHINHIVKNLLLFSQLKIEIRQTKCVVMMTKEGFTKIVNFMTPGAGVLALERGHMLYSGNAFFPNKIIFFTPRHRSNKLSI